MTEPKLIGLTGPADIGNTLLRGTDGSETAPDYIDAAKTMQIINDALKPCPEIDAITREMADQAEIAYQTLSDALGLSPQQMCDMTLTDLAATAAALLEYQPPAADAELLAKANRELSMRMAGVIEALRKAPALFASTLDNDQHLIASVEDIIAELIGEQTKASEQRHTIAGLQNLIAQIRATLDLSINASSMDILAEVENVSRLADRAIQIGARDAASGPYVVITTIHSGEINDINLAREKAELVAKRSTECRAAVAQIIASVELAPKWSDAA